METTYQYEDVKITGVVGKPEIARSNRSNQLFFVNKRYIKDKTLTAATEQAYKGLIPIGKFGFVILNIEMNPAKVDVNVHPAKLEVRFQEESKIFQAIYHAIKDTLLKTELVASTEKKMGSVDRSSASFEERLKNIRENNKQQQQGGLFSFRKQKEKEIEKYTEEESKIKTNVPVPQSDDLIGEKKIDNIEIGQPIDTSDVLTQLKQMKEKLEKELEEKENGKEIAEETKNYELEQNKEEKKEETTEIKSEEIPDVDSKIKDIQDEKVQKEFEEIKEKMKDLNDNPKVVSEDFNEMYTKMFGTAPIVEKEEPEEEKQESAIDIVKDNISVFEDQEKFQKPAYKFIGIVFKTYIILEIDKEMYILDQHAAHERIMYEKVKKNYYSDSSKDSQMLLLPDVITLTHKEMDIAKENIKKFEQAGFSLEEFGENTIKLTGVPTVCIDLDTKELFLETLDEINTVARTAKQEKEEKFIATVACKAAVKANMALTNEEVESLMDKLLQLPNPFTCPHGRPTAIKMTKYDIERKFARK